MNRAFWTCVSALALACGSDKSAAVDSAADVARGDCEEVTWYEDIDADGYGDSSRGQPGLSCEPPPLHSLWQGDCDDRASAVRPGAAEICDGLDNDCDGKTDGDDPGVQDLFELYVAADGDGYGTGASLGQSCTVPDGHAVVDGDCDDTRTTVHPGLSEVMDDGLDNDCDGLADLHGRLTGTWRELSGHGPAPGELHCSIVWNVTGQTNTTACPDCDLVFWVDALRDAGATDVYEAPCPGYDFTVGIAVLHGTDGAAYLGLIELIEGYQYYAYGAYQGWEDEYTLTPWPHVPVTLDEGVLSFEAGGIDRETSWGGETVYYTDWWGFEGTVE